MAEQIGTSPEDILKFTEELDQEMDSFKETYISNDWKGIPDFYRGKSHWHKERPSHKVSPVINVLRQAIERKTSQMTDTKPFMTILPYYDPLQRVADALEEIIASKWAEQSLDMTLTDVIFFAELFGGAGTNTTHNKELLFGKGDSTFELIDPRNLNFDPACTSAYFLDRAEYCRIEDVKAQSLLQYMYPKFASKIEADAPFDFYTPERRNFDRKGRIVKKVINRIRGNGSGAIGRSMLKEYWIQDRTLESGKLKYPGGRHIIIAGGCIVVDEANPYWDQRFPMDLLDWHRNPDSAWGDSEIEDLKQLQILLNKLVAVIVENGIMQSNGIWIGDNNALKPDQWNKLDNVPGLKVKKKPGSELRRESGTAVPPTVFSTVRYIEAAIEKLSGNTEVVQGGAPGEVKSGIAIEALQQAAMAIVRLKARTVEALLERIGQKMISRIFQFEGGDRQMFRLKGDKDYEAFKYMSDVLKGKGDDKAKKFLKDRKSAFKNFLFKIRPGSSMQMNKWQETAVAMQLYQAQPKPLIDREAVLDMIDLPNRQEIMTRMDMKERIEQENAIAMMAMQAQAGKQGQGGGTGEKGGSAPGPAINPRSPHAPQAAQEGLNKGQGIVE